MKMKIGAVIVSAGLGKRLGKADKAVLKLGNKPLFYHAFAVFRKITQIKEIVLVLRKTHLRSARLWCKPAKTFASLRGKDKRIVLTAGGKFRKDSVYNGLCALSKDIDYVLIHDCARPFVTKEIILRVLKELKKQPAVICGLKAQDTVKLIDDKGFIKKTLNRKNLFLVQTPQGFKKDLLLKAYKKFPKIRVFDDAQLLELAGKKVKVVAGDIGNFKITYPEDLTLAKSLT